MLMPQSMAMRDVGAVWEQSSMFLDFCNGKPGKG